LQKHLPKNVFLQYDFVSLFNPNKSKAKMLFGPSGLHAKGEEADGFPSEENSDQVC